MRDIVFRLGVIFGRFSGGGIVRGQERGRIAAVTARITGIRVGVSAAATTGIRVGVSAAATTGIRVGVSAAATAGFRGTVGVVGRFCTFGVRLGVASVIGATGGIRAAGVVVAARIVAGGVATAARTARVIVIIGRGGRRSWS